jgi:hypothetical protein
LFSHGVFDQGLRLQGLNRQDMTAAITKADDVAHDIKPHDDLVAESLGALFPHHSKNHFFFSPKHFPGRLPPRLLSSTDACDQVNGEEIGEYTVPQGEWLRRGMSLVTLQHFLFFWLPQPFHLADLEPGFVTSGQGLRTLISSSIPQKGQACSRASLSCASPVETPAEKKNSR